MKGLHALIAALVASSMAKEKSASKALYLPSSTRSYHAIKHRSQKKQRILARRRQ